ncbi:MAG: TerB family tellurite resistance protein [Thermoplasmatota archaeon]
MRWTTTHRFVFLALHLAQADRFVSPEEQRELAMAAQRMGLAAGLDSGRVDQMVLDACDAFHETDEVRPEIADTMDRLLAAYGKGSPILAAILEFLVGVARSDGVVANSEAMWLDEVADLWGV